MQVQGKSRGPLRLENLEKRNLLSTINTADFGAVPGDGRDDRAAFQAAINASRPGDTVHFAPGSYNVDGALILRSGRSYVGTDGTQPIGIANLPKFFMPQTSIHFTPHDNDGWGFKTEPFAHDILLSNFDIDSTQGAIGVGDGSATNISIQHNAITAHARHAVLISGVNGLNFVDNYFHDIFDADRSMEAFGISHANIDRNIIYHVKQGFHLLEIGDDVNLRFNVMRQIQAVGIEIQGHSAHRNMTLESNVYFDPMPSDRGHFALSVPTNNGVGTRIINNYIRGDVNGDPNQHHFAFPIETAGNGNGDPNQRVRIAGNILGGPGQWFDFVISATEGAKIYDNQCFGHPIVEAFGGEPGDNGHGSVDVGNNLLDGDWQHMPPPPAWVDQGFIPGSADATHTTVNDVQQSTTDSAPPGTPVFLSDMSVAQNTNGWGPVERDSSNGGKRRGDGTTISFDGKQHDKGFGVAVNSSITFKLDGKYSKFFSEFGIDDGVGNHGSMTFQVWADGKKIFDSGVMKGKTPSDWRVLDIAGAKELKLVTTDAGDGGRYDVGDWANAQVW